MMRSILIVSVILTWCSAIYSQEENACEHPDYNALVALYQATGGDSWIDNSNWDDGTGTVSCDPCGADWWNGVYCNSSNRVSAIYLGGNNLVGTIPKEIGYLDSLKQIQFESNSLSGELPNELVLLKKLEWLVVDGNNLSGKFPSLICHLPKLVLLGLSDNQFSGSIPDCIGDLNDLHEIALQANTFNGAIPSSIGSLSNLTSLNLNSNNLTGVLPEELSTLTMLRAFWVSNNELEGCFPASYTALCDIESVRFDGNLSTTLNNRSWAPNWDSFCSSGGTTHAMHPDYPALVAFYNATTGSVWDDNSNWDDGTTNTSCDPCADNWHGIECNEGRVTELQLAANNLSGSLPKEIGQLEYLDTINLFNNLISGEIPKEIGLIADLGYLDLGRNEFEGSLPLELGYLGNLTDLYIDNNNLEGCWPDEMYGMSIGSTIMNNNISPTISNAGWTAFQVSQAGRVHVDYDPLLSVYKELDGINWVRSDNWEPYNSCSDPCADDWHGVSCDGGRVVGLDLSVIDLKGELPENFEGLSELTRLNLGGNEIQGVFPGPIADLDKLTSLRMKGNQLTGELPFTMPWPLMDTLSLGHNILYGSPPDFYFTESWLNLKYVNLSNNLLSGDFVTNRNPIALLEYYNVSNNYLNGCFTNYTFQLCLDNFDLHTHGNLRLSDYQQYCQSGLGGCNDCTLFGDISINDDPIGYGYVGIARGSISSTGRVEMHNGVIFQADESIELRNNFTIEMNSRLILRIDECANLNARDQLIERK